MDFSIEYVSRLQYKKIDVQTFYAMINRIEIRQLIRKNNDDAGEKMTKPDIKLWTK